MGAMKLTTAEQRRIAMGAAASELLHTAQPPAEVSADDALKVLDDLARKEPELVASRWYLSVPESQFKLFVREWSARYPPPEIRRLRDRSLRDAAAWACDAFDQADTNGAVQMMDSRGTIVRAAINELKEVVLRCGGQVSLGPEGTPAKDAKL